MGAGCSSTKSTNVVSPEPTKRPLEKQSEKTAEPEKATGSGVASESQNAVSFALRKRVSTPTHIVRPVPRG